MKSIYEKLPGALLPWYEKNKRELPWRKDQDPYHIWLSEIMLQQTRVEAVKGYYARFLEALPTIESLAAAPQEQLDKLWEGLGYYSRVRNLKKAAQVIVNDGAGVFPCTYEEVRALPGIGDYTAGAVCSIAFGHKRAAVDGNVMRVISRLTGDDTPVDLPAYKKQVRLALEAVYPEAASEFTQALMELGATVCGPDTDPKCNVCPCKAFCVACKKDLTRALPVRLPKKKRRKEAMTVLILHCDGKFALRKRPEKGLLAGLWEFPHITGKPDLSALVCKVEEMGIKIGDIKKIVERKHVFTHIEWDMRGVYIDTKACCGDFSWFTAEQVVQTAALPTAFRQFWEETENV